MKEEPKPIVENYVNSYNNFDITGMLRDLEEDVIFENISNGQVDLEFLIGNGKIKRIYDRSF